ncbi:metal transporter [Paraferrimonas sedimenticola]|uniref:Metal transporter n=1 Tax=Paraferrimonas sedimenticola TaxID=375674 RepID=A0AA37RYK2_9GAMM|nr:metal transporter [Paraferrimonas sedimenticola]GLP97815.1 metal transporter [Paraferrimonas sedimenticola]
MTYLIAACVSLLIGPLFYRFFAEQHKVTKAIDGFVFVSIGGLLLTHILPELLHHGGLSAFVVLLAGLFGPSISERLFQKHSRLTHNFTLLLAFTGLLLHTFIDGSSVSVSDHDHGVADFLPLGIILHRLPEGLAIWWLLSPQFGNKGASFAIGLMLLGTLGGFAFGEHYANQLSLDNIVLLQAFVTGSILHVVWHQPHVEKSPSDHSRRSETLAGVGALLGILLLIALFSAESHSGHAHNHDHGHMSMEQLWQWTLAVAPYLLVTYLLGSLRFALGLRPDTNNPYLGWLVRLIGPEGFVFVGLILGWQVALFLALTSLILSAFLAQQKIPIDQVGPAQPLTLREFSLHYQVERSAPWVILSLLIGNMMHYPELLANQPWWQCLLLICLMMPLRFCFVGAAALGLTLAWAEWSTQAVLLALLAAPLINSQQLKKMSGPQGALTMGLVLGMVAAGQQWLEGINLEHAIAWPEQTQVLAVLVLGLLYAIALLRLGPRAFMARLFSVKFDPHQHHHH